MTHLSSRNDWRDLINTYVRPPRPIAVKKFIAKRVFRGLSRGKRPSKYICNVLKIKGINCETEWGSVWENNTDTHWSLSLSFNFDNPIYSANSWNNILMNIRLEKKYMQNQHNEQHTHMLHMNLAWKPHYKMAPVSDIVS